MTACLHLEGAFETEELLACLSENYCFILHLTWIFLLQNINIQIHNQQEVNNGNNAPLCATRSAAGRLSVRVWAASVQYLISVPLKAGSFCSSRLLLRLKREELCLLSFLTGVWEPGCFPFNSCVVGGMLLLAFLLALCGIEAEKSHQRRPGKQYRAPGNVKIFHESKLHTLWLVAEKSCVCPFHFL